MNLEKGRCACCEEPAQVYCVGRGAWVCHSHFLGGEEDLHLAEITQRMAFAEEQLKQISQAVGFPAGEMAPVLDRVKQKVSGMQREIEAIEKRLHAYQKAFFDAFLIVGAKEKLLAAYRLGNNRMAESALRALDLLGTSDMFEIAKKYGIEKDVKYAKR